MNEKIETIYALSDIMFCHDVITYIKHINIKLFFSRHKNVITFFRDILYLQSVYLLFLQSAYLTLFFFFFAKLYQNQLDANTYNICHSCVVDLIGNENFLMAP